jgi:hypothetical protein
MDTYLFVEILSKHHQQKQNLLVCGNWYNAYVLCTWNVRNPEYVDWIKRWYKVRFEGDYKDVKYRISCLNKIGIFPELHSNYITACDVVGVDSIYMGYDAGYCEIRGSRISQDIHMSCIDSIYVTDSEISSKFLEFVGIRLSIKNTPIKSGIVYLDVCDMIADMDVYCDELIIDGLLSLKGSVHCKILTVKGGCMPDVMSAIAGYSVLNIDPDSWNKLSDQKKDELKYVQINITD